LIIWFQLDLFKDKHIPWPLAVAVSVFTLTYLLKQTLLGLQHKEAVLFTLAGASLMIVGMSWRQVFEELRKSNILFMLPLLAISMLFSMALFQSQVLIQQVSVKIALLFWFTMLALVYGRSLFIVLADTVLISLTLIVCIAEIGLIPTQYSGTEWWTKNFGGFSNPNLPPIFAFTALITYFAFRAYTKFWFCLIVILLAWLWIDIHSRAVLLGVLMLLLYAFVSSSTWLSRKLMDCMHLAAVITITLYLVVMLVLFFGHLDLREPWLASLNNMLSNRLEKMTRGDLALLDEGPIFFIEPHDSIYYELIFLFGPIAFGLYSYTVSIISKRWMSAPGGDVVAYTLYVFSIVGLFEGLLMKFSPIVIFVLVSLIYGSTLMVAKENPL
jgi:hypothetical protein